MEKEYYHGARRIDWDLSLESIRELNISKQRESPQGLYPWLDNKDGFYLSDNIEMGAAWAIYNTILETKLKLTPTLIKDKPCLFGYIRTYFFDLENSGLDILDIRDMTKKENLLKAFAIYLDANRQYLLRDVDEGYKQVTFKSGAEYCKVVDRFDKFLEKYLPKNWENKDVIVSYRLDSRYRHALNDFAFGKIEEGKVVDIMELGEFGVQICLRTKRAENYVKSFGKSFDQSVIEYYNNNVDKMLEAYRDMSKRMLRAKKIYNKIISDI